MTADCVQLELELEWGGEPWLGRSPRSLTKVGLAGLARLRIVDKCGMMAEPARADEIGDPRQYLALLQGGPSHGS